MPGDSNKGSMTQGDGARIQSAQVSLPDSSAHGIDLTLSKAKSGGDMSSGGFAARAQSAGAHNANNAASSGGNTGAGNNAGANGGQKK